MCVPMLTKDMLNACETNQELEPFILCYSGLILASACCSVHA